MQKITRELPGDAIKSERETRTQTVKLDVENQELEAPRSKIGTEVEVKRVDGITLRDIVAGTATIGDKQVDVFARGKGDDVKLRVVEPGEVEEREKAARRVEMLEGALEKVVEASIKAAGIKGEEAEKVYERIVGYKLSIIARATEHEDPEKWTIDEVRRYLSKKEHASLSLLDLEAERAKARRKVEKIEDPKERQQALQHVYALDKLVFETRSALHPRASTAEKAQIADDIEGAVKPQPDPLYDKGLAAVQKRIRELEDSMRKADKNPHGELLWMAARAEYDRHRAMLPTLERAEAVAEAERQVGVLLAQQLEAIASVEKDIEGRTQETIKKHKEATKAARARIQAKRSYWRKVGNAIWNTLQQIDPKQLEQNQEALDKLQEIQKRLITLNEENEQLKKLGIALDFDEDEMLEPSRMAFARTLRDMYKNGQKEATMHFVEEALSGNQISEATRSMLEAFKIEIAEKERVFTIDEKVRVDRKGVGMDDGWTITVLDGIYAVVRKEENGKKLIMKIRLDDLRVANQARVVTETVTQKVPMQFDVEDDGRDLDQEVRSISPSETREKLPTQKRRIGHADTDERQKVRIANTYETRIAHATTRERPIGEDGDESTDFTDEEAQMQDLIDAGILQQGGDLETYRATFNELQEALEKNGTTLENAGLPRTFDDLLNTKDSRGWWARKVFRKTPDRVKQFERLQQLHSRVFIRDAV